MNRVHRGPATIRSCPAFLGELIERPDWNDFKARAGAARSRNRDAQCRMGGRRPLAAQHLELPAWTTASAIVSVLSGYCATPKEVARVRDLRKDAGIAAAGFGSCLTKGS